MLFAILCHDKPDHEAVRLKTREAHLHYLKNCGHRVHLAGPMLDDSGEHMVGSILIMDFPDMKTAQAFCASDPYKQAGLFADVVIRRWKQSLPPPA